MFKELWVDDPIKVVLKDNYIKQLRDLDFSTISIMSNYSVRPYSLIWDIKNIEKLVNNCIKNDIETSVTLWVKPNINRIDNLINNYIKQLYETGISAIEFDLEHLWKEKHLYGYNNLGQAARDLNWKLEEAREVYHDIRIDVTTHPWHKEATEDCSMTLFADRLYLQAYGLSEIRGKTTPWEKGPGYMQHFAINKADWLPEHVKLCLGLPTWNQVWRQHTPYEALKKAYDTCLHNNIPIVRYWSSKFVVGVRKNDYAYNFFKDLCK